MNVELLSIDSRQQGDDKRIAELFSQLSSRKQITLDTLLDPSNSLYLACIRKDGHIIGMASMCTYKVISGYKGWIEDVVVDQNYRGLGAGKALIEFLINKGKNLDLTEIFLFTEDEKKAAISLYLGLGFKEKGSRLYNLDCR